MALMSSYLVQYIEHNIPVFTTPLDSPNMTAFGIALAGVVVGAAATALCLRVRVSYRNYNPDEHGEEMRGMKRSLLIFVGFVLLLPVAEIVRLFDDKYLFSSNAWQLLTGQHGKLYSPWWGSAILFSSAMRGLTLVLSIALALLVVLRRRTVRWAVPAYLLAIIAVGAVENIFYVQIFIEGGEAILQQHFDRTVSVLTLSVLLVPYLWVSKRVHATFRN